MKALILGAALAAIQPPALIPFGVYDRCEIFGAATPTPLPARWSIEFYDVPNYSFLDQPGAYELRGSKIHWTSGILKSEEPGDYDPVARTVRFRPVTVMGGLPSGTRLVCTFKG